MPASAPARTLSIDGKSGRPQPFFKTMVRILGPDREDPIRLQGSAA
jgi:hypothetical protein